MVGIKKGIFFPRDVTNFYGLLIAKIKALKSQGESSKTIRETLRLDQREYEWLADSCSISTSCS